ncbi:hypothetical protein SPBR_05405 [Sporothrix brasiliensis 5110]|uniref:Uncharacterized protein n=1 Tax=Sporothrix brasiliensis 5110 TaxID=1398154 RepID=A0A0C2IFA5_9PEZI|nr:uncharacterized protein SPBR_05405 [Sporothrix brasiliensis 5110]KIH87906.1 hypothetical protein SPBR_05405 [Sporothrix brasiliensis 5110]
MPIQAMVEKTYGKHGGTLHDAKTSYGQTKTRYSGSWLWPCPIEIAATRLAVGLPPWTRSEEVQAAASRAPPTGFLHLVMIVNSGSRTCMNVLEPGAYAVG